MIKLRVCVGTSCHLKGSYNIVMTFQQLMEEYNMHDKIDMQVAFCMGNCQDGVCVTLDEEIFSVEPATARAFFLDEVVKRAKA